MKASARVETPDCICDWALKHAVANGRSDATNACVPPTTVILLRNRIAGRSEDGSLSDSSSAFVVALVRERGLHAMALIVAEVEQTQQRPAAAEVRRPQTFVNCAAYHRRADGDIGAQRGPGCSWQPRRQTDEQEGQGRGAADCMRLRGFG